MMKKVVSILIAATFFLIPFTQLTSAKVVSEDFSLVLNMQKYIGQSNEQGPYINQDKRIMVPVRFVSEELGANVDWNNETNTAIITKENKTISIKIGEPQIKVNSETIKMNTKAELTKARTFIPARYIAESLGTKVEWDGQTKTVSIKTDSFKPTNIEEYGLTLKQEFPIMKENKGLKVTLNSLYIYPYDSKEGQKYVEKYAIAKNPNMKEKYLFLTDMTLENTSERTIRVDGYDMNDKVYFGVKDHQGNGGLSSVSSSKIYNLYKNNTTYLNSWVLKPSEKITGTRIYMSYENNINTIELKVYDSINNLLLAVKE